MGKYRYYLFILGVLLFFYFVVPVNAAPAISGITDNRSIYSNSQIPQYEKLEITFNITNTVAKNLNFSYAPYSSSIPYPNANNFINEEQGITVDGQFLPPGETDWSKAYIQPAFYYQDFTSQTHPYLGLVDWYYPNGNFSWKIRFAPIPYATGNTWKYRIIATDASGSTTSSEQSFTATNPLTTSSSRHGFVRVSQKDKRYFELQDGTYFPGLGYNMNYDILQWINPVSDAPTSLNNSNPVNFASMATNGIQLIRIWLSEWSIYGAGWNPWKAAVGAGNDPPWNWLDLEAGTNPDSEFAVLVGSGNQCMIYGLSTYHPAVKPNTTYRFRLNYASQGLTGSGNYGIAIRLSTDTPNCGNNGNLTSNVNILPSYPHTATTSWQTIDGTYTTKSNEYFLPYIFVSADNVTGGWASFRSLAVQEDLGNNQYGVNVLTKPIMDHHLYFDQRQSYAFDQVVEMAKANGVYLRPVILDHREETLNTLDTVYGNYDYSMSRGRWLETQWYRYLQARWGYSTAIHSWEFVNEGDPGNSHVYGADYMGRYMHGRYSSGTYDSSKYFADWHLSATSVWSGSTADWGLDNYPDIDFADFHQYITKTIPDPSNPNNQIPNPIFYDTAGADYNASMANTGAGRPVIRGETGFTDSGTQPGTSDFLSDTSGVWLHNFVWGGINSGGIIESYWYSNYSYGHIYTGTFDLRPQYKYYYNFIKDVPLNNGNYIDAAATAPSGIRAWGQKDLTNKRAHLWISNANYRWNNQSPSAVSGNVTISGFSPNTSYKLETWNTYTGAISSTQNITSNSSGVITLNVTSLVKDYAVRIGDYNLTPTVTPTSGPSLTPTPNPACRADVNLDNTVNLKDLIQVLSIYATSSTGVNDINSDGKINGADTVSIITNWGVSCP